MAGERVALASANLGRGVGAKKFRQTIRGLVNQMEGNAEHWVIGLQEIDEADAPEERKILQEMFPDANWVGRNTKVPIMTSPGVKVLHRKVTRASPGLPKMSPARVVTEGIFEVGGVRFGMVNTHFPRWTKRLRSRWWMVWAVVKARVRWLMRSGDVFLTMDANRRNLRRVNRRERRLIAVRLDYISRFKRAKDRWKWSVVWREVFSMKIDGHDAPIVVIEPK